MYRLRRNTGINFNCPTINTIEEASELKENICEFAEINTIDVPDKKKYRKGIRYRTTSLLCLFYTFQVEYPDECTYSTFTKYWPAHYVKPCPSEFGTCLCILCQNMELKFIALQTRKLICSVNSLEDIIDDARNDEYQRENQFKSEVEALADDDKKRY